MSEAASTRVVTPSEEEIIPPAKPDIIVHMYQKELEEKDKIVKFQKHATTPIVEFLKAHVEEIRNVQGIAELVTHGRKTLEIKDKLLLEFEENIKPGNLIGPIGNWSALIPQIVHDFLLFFHHYYLYADHFLAMAKQYSEIQQIFETLPQNMGMPIEKILIDFVRYPVRFKTRLQALQAATEPAHADFKKIGGLIDQINAGLSKIEAATSDGHPPKIQNYDLAFRSNNCPYGVMVNVTSTVANVVKEPTKGMVISKISSKSQTNDTQIQAELEANRITKHRNVMKMIALLEDELFWYILWPDTTGYTLKDLISHQKTLIEEAARPIFRQMMLALQHIHSCDIVMNNIMPKTIVFYKNTVRFTNFSTCRFAEKSDMNETYFLKSAYASPESFSKKPYNGMLSDIWACGIILYEMLAGKPPFSGSTTESLGQKVRKGNVIYPKTFSSQVIQLLKGIFSTVPSERYSIEQILSHPWLLKTEEVPISNICSVGFAKKK